MKLDKDTLLSNLAPSELIEDVIKPDELEALWKLAFTGGMPRKNAYGNIFIAGRESIIKKAYEIVKDRLGSIHGELFGGNYFITAQPYGVHIDSFSKENSNLNSPFGGIKKKNIINDNDYTVYRNVVIPLWVGGMKENQNTNAGKLVLMKQRLVDYSCDLIGGENIENYKESFYKGHTDYSILQYYDAYGKQINKNLNSVKFDKELYEECLYHLPYTRLTGLTVENAFDWLPGNIMVLDGIQVHCSSLNKKNTTPESHDSIHTEYNRMRTLSWINKMGLLLKFKVKVNGK